MAKAKLNPETGKMQPTGNYPVGFARTPVATRYRRGQCGNTKGRPKGKRNVKVELKEIVEKQYEVTEKETGKKRKMSLVAANLLAHGSKGAKGDARSGKLFLDQVRMMGWLGLEDNETADRQASIKTPLTSSSRPSELLFQNLAPEMLSREEQVELSRLAELIDLGGDLTALSSGDFERVKDIMNKGRKDVTPK